VFICVGWQVTLCDPMWHSSAAAFVSYDSYNIHKWRATTGQQSINNILRERRPVAWRCDTNGSPAHTTSIWLYSYQQTKNLQLKHDFYSPNAFHNVQQTTKQGHSIKYASVNDESQWVRTLNTWCRMHGWWPGEDEVPADVVNSDTGKRKHHSSRQKMTATITYMYRH